MADKNNATCAICGKDYYMCLSCKDVASVNPWKKHTDTSEHYKVYQVLHGYSTGVYTKEEAKSKFAAIDLTDIDTFRDGIKKTIEEIMREDAKVAELDVLDGIGGIVHERPRRKRTYERKDEVAE